MSITYETSQPAKFSSFLGSQKRNPNMFKFTNSCLAITLFFAPLTASAHDWEVEGHVVTLEGSNMPQYVPFSIDVPAGNCQKGTFLQWNIKGADAASRIANAQYVASILLTAKSAGNLIRIFGNNSDCTVDYIWAE